MTRAATVDAVSRFGVAPADVEDVRRRLGRDPNPVEARMFAVMWSEHCGYKHSKRVLRRLPTASSRVLSGPGENAGVLAIGQGWAVAFKIESHNHPSAVDPYNGAATGVGGIIRDVLAMGARPIALLDSLRFGVLDDIRSRRLLGGVVAGIAGYGDAIGVPTVGGELLVHPRYRENPLVNVACLGLVRSDRVTTSAAAGPGNAVIYAGARTGRDGIGGAAFASTELDQAREQIDRASVQIGDPFTGKLLIEATLEALATGVVVAIQDMGAAGLTCATSEMAARGGVGMAIDLDRVPLREADMRPEEILLSESQERMLLVARPDGVDHVLRAYRRWGLAAEVIGTITETPSLVARWDGRTLVDLPPDALASAPVYDPPAQAPAAARPSRPGLEPDVDVADALLRLLAHPDVASKYPVFEQYDFSVGIRTVTPPGHDAAVLRVLEAPPLGVAVVAEGNGRWCTADPRRGAALIVLEAASNLACAGAEPIGVTDCLNFGSPERPEVFWAFREAVEGIAEACESLGVPVIGGNVSFYNEAEGAGGERASGERAVLPTPVVAMVGLLEDVSRHGRPGFARSGDAIVLVGGDQVSLDASLYCAVTGGEYGGAPVNPDFDRALAAIRCVREAVRLNILESCHDCGDGGLAVAVAEACIQGEIGAEVAVSRDTATRGSCTDGWFGEGPGRFVVSVAPSRLPELQAHAAVCGATCAVIGTVGGDALSLLWRDGQGGLQRRALPLDSLAAAWRSLEV